MKDYNEMAKAVFERRDEFVANRKKQRATLLKAGVPVCALALVCVLGVTLRFDKLPEIPQLPPYSVTETTDESGLTNSTQEITTPENPGNTQNNSDPTQSGEAENSPQTTTSANQNSTRPTENNGVNNDSPDTRPVTPPAQDPTEPSEEMPTQPPSRPGPETTPPTSSIEPVLPTEPNWPEDSEPDFTEPEESDPWEPDFTEPVATDPCIPPDFSGPDMEPETTEPDCSDSTEPDTVTPTEPVEKPTQTEPVVEDDTPFIYPEESFDGDAQIICGDRTYSADVGDRITYVVELKAQEGFEDIQLMVRHSDALDAQAPDNSENIPEEEKALPHLTGFRLNCKATYTHDGVVEPVVRMNAICLEKFDFRKRKVLMRVDFIVTEPGEYFIELVMECMSIDSTRCYFDYPEGQQIFEGIEIYEYILVN